METLRRWIAVVLVLGMLGTIVELILLEHYEQPLQLVPVILILAGGGALLWHSRSQDQASRMTLIAVMAVFVVSGFAGFVAHFLGSAEFQLELNPDMGTGELLAKILRAKAPPLLAPGMMIQMGLLGLAYVWSDRRSQKGTEQ